MNRYISHSHNSVSQRFSLNRIDLTLFIPPLLLVLLGLVTFYFIDISIFRQQFFFLLFSLIAYFIFLNIDYRIFGYYSKVLYIGMICLLLVLFVIGVEAKGAVRWIDIFGIRLQFSEIIKPFFVIFFAAFLSKDESRSFSKFVKSLLLLFPLFFLTLRQPDLGNALIYFFTCLFMLLMYGFSFKIFFSAFCFSCYSFSNFFQSSARLSKKPLTDFFLTRQVILLDHHIMQFSLLYQSGAEELPEKDLATQHNQFCAFFRKDILISFLQQFSKA